MELSLRMLRLCMVGLLTQARLYSALVDSKGPSTLPPRIAVVGGGIGGTSAAYFLHELFEDQVLVDVYEPSQVGGRLATLSIGGYDYEVGGTIIHPKNLYMVEFAKKLGLRESIKCDSTVGLYDGHEFVYRDSSWAVVSLARLFWRYGFSALKLSQLMENMLTKFERIYTLQREGKVFKNVSSMLSALDPEFLQMTQVSTVDWMRSQGYDELLIEELVTAVTQCNYGQTQNVHAFLGAISIAAADPQLWSVMGGNKLVAELLLKESRASILKRRVTSIAPSDTKGFQVTSVEAKGSSHHLFTEGNLSSRQRENSQQEESKTQHYDMVLIATPLTSDKTSLKLVNFTQSFSFPGYYQRIVCTMIQGKLHSKAFNLNEDDLVQEILVTNSSLFFNSIGMQQPTNSVDCSNYLPVWKVFSPAPLNKKQLDSLFPGLVSVDSIDWLAYPHYDSHQNLGDFELIPGLYHINAIEWAGSAMEMSIIGAKNVALLAHKHWMGDSGTSKFQNLGKNEL